jgi:uncharacterized protein YwqG
MHLPQELLPAFDAAIERFGLSQHRDLIASISSLAYRAELIKSAPDIGASKFGGTPDLPKGIPWPESDDRLFVFVAQINLSELPALCRQFPRDGLLSFFIGTDEPAYNIEHRILYHHDISKLVRKQMPKGKEFVEGCVSEQEDPGPFAESAVSFIPVVMVPPFPDHVKDLESVSEVHGPMHKLSYSLRGMEGVKRTEESFVLGPTDDCSGNPAKDAMLIANGYSEILFDSHRTLQEIDADIENSEVERPGYVPYLVKKRPLLEKYIAHRDEHQKEIGEWMNLLVLDSHQKLRMCWWDAGNLRFLVRARDLQAKDFSKTYCCISSS